MRATLRRLGSGLGLPQLAFLLALLVPVLAGTWAFSELAARREVARVDAHLRASLAASVDEYGDVLESAQRRARALAAAPSVQRAFSRGDRRALAALERRHPQARLLLAGEPTPADDAVRQVDVVVSGKRVGRVVVVVSVADDVLERLRRRAALAEAEQLTVIRDGTVVPGTTRPAYATFDGVEYRALVTTLRPGAPRISLAVMRERGAIRAAVDDVRRRIFIVGAVALLSVALLGYLFAPSLARSRVRRRQRTQAERVLAQLSDGVLEVDGDGVVTFWNPAAETLTGMRAGSVLGRRAVDAVPGWPALAAAARAEGAATVPLEAGDREHWVSVAAVDSDGGTVYAFRDVTRERRLEEIRAELIATVSHELRTPLAAVYGAAMTLQRASALDEATREQLIGVVGHQAERLARIVDDILTASRAAAEEGAETRAAPVDVVAVARASVHDATTRTGRPITLETAEEALTASGDADDVRRVLDNLLDNAVKYSPDDTPVAVRAERRAASVCMLVVDEGIGIPREEQERIFERFYRLDPTMARGVGGTGLGLYIARRLAERMGGRLTVVSEAGEGASFCLELSLG